MTSGSGRGGHPQARPLSAAGCPVVSLQWGKVNKINQILCAHGAWTDTNLVVVRQAVDLVDKHLKADVRIDLVRLGHGHVQFGEGLNVVVLGGGGMCWLLFFSGQRANLGINHKDNGSAASKDHLRVKRRVEKVDLAREIPHLELDKRAVGNV